MSRSATATQHYDHPAIETRPVPPPIVIDGSEQAKTGSVLIRPGTALPRALAPSFRQAGEWNLVAGVSVSDLDQLLRREGWSFFHLVPAVKRWALAFSFHAALRKALYRVLHRVEADNLNAVEIADVQVRRFLGVYYVALTVHPRHVRASPFLRNLHPHRRAEALWDFARGIGGSLTSRVFRRTPDARYAPED